MQSLEQRELNQPPSAGDDISARCALIEVRVAELWQLFNAIDPSSLNERDLDPSTEEFIVSWSRELPRAAPLALLVHLDRPAGPPEEVEVLRDAIHQFFTQRAVVVRRRLRALLRRGRISLLIGLAFLAGAFTLSELLTRWASGGVIGILRESVVIGGWVAMWRPLEIFLYDWWPIRAEARLLDRLSVMAVRIRYGAKPVSNAWRTDWPASSNARRDLAPSAGSRT